MFHNGIMAHHVNALIAGADPQAFLRIPSQADGLEHWLAVLPADLWRARPRLWLARAAALLTRADDAAIEALRARSIIG